MDLVSHGIAGAALTATFVPNYTGRCHQAGDGLLLFASVLASIAPDVDLWLPPQLGEGAKGLEYLLYHRGHTHTILGCLALAMLVAGVTKVLGFLAPRSYVSVPRLLLLTSAATLLHLGMDATNDYGVHPFWPFYNGWIYGDFIFLAEPMIGAALLPLAFLPFLRARGTASPSSKALWLLWLLGLALIAYYWVRVIQGAWVTLLAAVLGTFWLLGQLIAQSRLRSMPFAWLSVATVWAVFFVCSRVVKAETVALLTQRAPDERLVQLVTTPAPSNPLCFRIVSASKNDKTKDVRVRIGAMSLIPALSSPKTCYTPNTEPLPNAVLEANDLGVTNGWHWLGTFMGSLREFDDYAANSCPVRYMKHFLRAPFWSRRSGETQIVAGDLRFDYEKDLNAYCKYRYTPGAHEDCPRLEPPWVSPFFEVSDAEPAHGKQTER